MNNYRIEIYNQNSQHAKYYLLSSKSEINHEKLSEIATEVLSDQAREEVITEQKNIKLADNIIDVHFKPGVTDNRAHSSKEAIQLVYPDLDIEVYSGELHFIDGDKNLDELSKYAKDELGNPLLNQFKIMTRDQFESIDRFSNIDVPEVKINPKPIQTYNLDITEEEFNQLNSENCWALTFSEFQQIQDYYAKEDVQKERLAKGLPSDPTDVELEVIAQSWSEHCKHKIFASNITYTESENTQNKLGNLKVESIYKSYIKKATRNLEQSGECTFTRSVFSDNAGVVEFDKNVYVCAKVETHNSPSALDPYGGALTGILGVNRDVLGCGIGFKPIANTDVFCFATPKLEKSDIKLPGNLLAPSAILKGVHKGVEDGGNKSGIPNVNGAFYFDDQYAGKPLVYCGTIGVIPQKLEHYPDVNTKGQRPGDAIFMVGGKIGADGIHGATFSSLELDENAPATAVQIGDPLTQKRVTDFMLSARARGLYNSVTDNGAGGLSSSVGEMAEETNGAKIDLALCPTKYPGLSVYELMISESQERMTFSVPKENIDAFKELAQRFKVDASHIGEFTDSSYLEVFYNQKPAALLGLHFLHQSLHPMELKAHFDGEKQINDFKYWHHSHFRKTLPTDIETITKTVLANPNVASKESLIRKYDHEVQAATSLKYFSGQNQNSPNDSGVIDLSVHGGEKNNGLAISCGLKPKLSYYDTYTMTQYAIDEAVRNAVGVGADPDKMALLDNYCWPDTITSQRNPDGAHKLAQLVRSGKALFDMAMTYKMPFISGKDSMKNDYIGKNESGEDLKISVHPTLLVTAVSQVPKLDHMVSSSFKKAGDNIYLIGHFHFDRAYYGEIWEEFEVQEVLKPAPIDAQKNIIFYQKFHAGVLNKLFQSVHDVSDGGALISIIESGFGNNIGAKVDLNIDPNLLNNLLFNEYSGSFIVSVDPAREEEFKKFFKDFKLMKLGTTQTSADIQLFNQDKIKMNTSLETLEQSWRFRHA